MVCIIDGKVATSVGCHAVGSLIEYLVQWYCYHCHCAFHTPQRSPIFNMEGNVVVAISYGPRNPCISVVEKNMKDLFVVGSLHFELKHRSKRLK